VEKKTLNLDSLEAIRARFEALRTFEDVEAFDTWAGTQLDQIDAVSGDALDQQNRKRQAVEGERARLEGLNFFSRLFASKKQLQLLEAEASEAERIVETLVRYQDEMAEMIEFSPDNPADQKALLKELRLQKKELRAEKNDVAANMRAIRQEHREAGAGAGRYLGGLVYDRKLAGATRRALRISQEKTLRPHESQKEALDRQIRAVERRILWTERFGHDDEVE